MAETLSIRARLGIVRIYLAAFTNPEHWTAEDHEAGLVAVYRAGAAAERRRRAAETAVEGSDRG